MSKSIIILSVIFALSFSTIDTSNVISENWNRIVLAGIASFDMPPTMEIKRGGYGVKSNDGRTVTYNEAKIIAQQKGLNNKEEQSLKKYARIMVETEYGSPGKFMSLNFDVAGYSQAEINEISEMLKQQMIAAQAKVNVKILTWYPLKMETINGMSTIHMSYKRQLTNRPPVIVHIYSFHNYDRMHKLTLSYRQEESAMWASDFDKILKSFRILSKK